MSFICMRCIGFYWSRTFGSKYIICPKCGAIHIVEGSAVELLPFDFDQVIEFVLKQLAA